MVWSGIQILSHVSLQISIPNPKVLGQVTWDLEDHRLDSNNYSINYRKWTTRRLGFSTFFPPSTNILIIYFIISYPIDINIY